MSDAIRILEKLLEPSRQSRKAKRLKETLKDPQAPHDPGWHFVPGPPFNDALDMRLTESVQEKKATRSWTQGSNFAFKRGDVLFDTPDGYGNWQEALKRVGSCVQVLSARDVCPPTGEKERDPGQVLFAVLRPDGKRTKLERVDELEMTQDEFVRFLILGSES